MIAVVLLLAVFEHGAQPDGMCAKALNIIQPAHDALEVSSLEHPALFRIPTFWGRIGIIRGYVLFVIVEPIHQQKIDERVPPILRGGKDRASWREIQHLHGCNSVSHLVTLSNRL